MVEIKAGMKIVVLCWLVPGTSMVTMEFVRPKLIVSHVPWDGCIIVQLAVETLVISIDLGEWEFLSLFQDDM